MHHQPPLYRVGVDVVQLLPYPLRAIRSRSISAAKIVAAQVACCYSPFWSGLNTRNGILYGSMVGRHSFLLRLYKISSQSNQRDTHLPLKACSGNAFAFPFENEKRNATRRSGHNYLRVVGVRRSRSRSGNIVKSGRASRHARTKAVGRALLRAAPLLPPSKARWKRP
jgi:hypothetical protein